MEQGGRRLNHRDSAASGLAGGRGDSGRCRRGPVRGLSELLACLTKDWCQGRLRERWWWRALVRDGDHARLVVEAWLAAPTYIAAALGQLTQLGWGQGVCRNAASVRHHGPDAEDAPRAWSRRTACRSALTRTPPIPRRTVVRNRRRVNRHISSTSGAVAAVGSRNSRGFAASGSEATARRRAHGPAGTGTSADAGLHRGRIFVDACRDGHVDGRCSGSAERGCTVRCGAAAANDRGGPTDRRRHWQCR